MIGCWVFQRRNKPTFAWPHPMCCFSKRIRCEKIRPGPKGLNKNLFFKEPIKIDGYYFKPSGKPGLGYEYDEKFVVSRKRLA